MTSGVILGGRVKDVFEENLNRRPDQKEGSQLYKYFERKDILSGEENPSVFRGLGGILGVFQRSRRAWIRPE